MQTKDLSMHDLVGKKHCTHLIEVNQAPPDPVTDTQLRETVFSIQWEDGTKGDYKCTDLIRVPLQDLPSLVTYVSHGMESFDFVRTWLEKYPQHHLTTEMAIYHYKKINDQPHAD